MLAIIHSIHASINNHQHSKLNIALPMLHSFRLPVRLSCLTLVISLLIGCGSSDPNDEVIASVEILPNDKPIISLGQEVQLGAVAKNSSGSEISSGSVTWESSDVSVLSVNSSGMMKGESNGTSTISATAGGKTGTVDFRSVDLSGIWVGGEDGDSVSYTLTQTGTMVDGTFQSSQGFPPITDVNTGVLTGDLNFGRYFHTLDLNTEENCMLQIKGAHNILVDEEGELVLAPDQGTLSSTNCSIFGTIDFATLRRQ